MLAKAVATEAGANFINISMSSITSKVCTSHKYQLRLLFSVLFNFNDFFSFLFNFNDFFSFLLNFNDVLSIACSGLVKGKSMSKQFSH